MFLRKRAIRVYKEKVYEDPLPLVTELEDRIQVAEAKESIRDPFHKPTFDQIYNIVRRRLMDKDKPLDDQVRLLLMRRTKLANYARVCIRATGTPSATILGFMDKDQAFQLLQVQYEKFLDRHKDREKQAVPSGIMRQIVQVKYNRMIVNYYEPRAAEAFEKIAKLIHITKPFEPPTIEEPKLFTQLYAKWKTYFAMYHSFALDALFNVRIKLLYTRVYQVSGSRNKMTYARQLRRRKRSFVACAAFLVLLEGFVQFCQTTLYSKEDLERREAIHRRFRDILGPYNKYIIRYIKAGEKLGNMNGWMAQHAMEPDLTKFAEPFVIGDPIDTVFN